MLRLARVAALVVATCALSGCVNFTSENTFSDHDTVTQDTIVALAPEAADQLGVDLDQLNAATITSQEGSALPGIDPAKVTIEDYREGDLQGIHVVARDLTLDEFNAASTSGVEGVTQGVGAPMTVTREGDDYVITIPADESRDLSGVRGGSSLGLISSAITFELSFTFPGPVKSATAGDVNGKTVVLSLEDLLTPDEIVIRGQATEGIAWTPILRWAGIIAAALVIIAGAAFLIWQDKRRQRPRSLPDIPGEDPA